MAQEMSAKVRDALQAELTMVGKLLALEGVRKHDTRFDNEVALVASAESREAVDGVVQKSMSAPVKAAGSPMDPEFSADGLLDAMGGIRGDQTLYAKELGDNLLVYVAFWPWGSGKSFTIKIGVFEKGAGPA
jgi:hypothetical protein